MQLTSPLSAMICFCSSFLGKNAMRSPTRGFCTSNRSTSACITIGSCRRWCGGWSAFTAYRRSDFELRATPCSHRPATKARIDREGEGGLPRSHRDCKWHQASQSIKNMCVKYVRTRCRCSGSGPGSLSPPDNTRGTEDGVTCTRTQRSMRGHTYIVDSLLIPITQ